LRVAKICLAVSQFDKITLYQFAPQIITELSSVRAKPVEVKSSTAAVEVRKGTMLTQNKKLQAIGALTRAESTARLLISTFEIARKFFAHNDPRAAQDSVALAKRLKKQLDEEIEQVNKGGL
jgi:hypothetical protein